MKQTFSFDLPPTLNQQIQDARSSIYKSAEVKADWTAKIAARTWGKPKFDGKVWISFTWYIILILFRSEFVEKIYFHKYTYEKHH